MRGSCSAMVPSRTGASPPPKATLPRCLHGPTHICQQVEHKFSSWTEVTARQQSSWPGEAAPRMALGLGERTEGRG